MAIRIQQGNTHTISHIQHMYSKMHAAIDMHHMNGNMNMINIYTPPAKQYHTPAIHKKHHSTKIALYTRYAHDITILENQPFRRT